MDLTPENKASIDARSYEGLLSRAGWMNSPDPAELRVLAQRLLNKNRGWHPDQVEASAALLACAEREEQGVWVPRNPTEMMLTKGAALAGGLTRGQIEQIYLFMLAAAKDKP